MESIIQTGIGEGVFLTPDILDVQIAINSIIGTINWSLYNLLIVKNESIKSQELAKKLSDPILRSLGYQINESF